MVKEIYIRTPEDPNFETGIVHYSNEIESIITQIRVILNTKPGDVLGNEFIGSTLDYYIYNTKKDAVTLKKMVDEQISLYVYHSPNITITTELNFGDSGKGYDYAVLDIYINGTKSIGFLINKDE